MFDTVQAFVLLVIGFGFVIFVHELGHFAVAKAVGVKVTQFAIGFGQALLAYRKGMGASRGSTEPLYHYRIRQYLRHHEQAAKGPVKLPKKPVTMEDLRAEFSDNQIAEAGAAMGFSETEYRLNWMPLGGYVKMLGQEDLNPAAMSDDPRSFNRKPVWARAAVISAGVIMNVIFALIFFTIVFLHGLEQRAPVIGFVEDGSPAQKSYAEGHAGDSKYLGIEPGDKVYKINDTPVEDFGTIQITSALAGEGETLRFHVRRGSESLVFPVVPERNKTTNMLMVGVGNNATTTLADVEMDLPVELAKANVRPGMKITKAGDMPVDDYAQLRRVLLAAKGEPVSIRFEPTDKAKGAKPVTIEARATPRLAYDEDAKQFHWLGLVVPATVQMVLEDTPAARAGIKQRDTILRIGQTTYPHHAQVTDLIKATDGRPFGVTLDRDGKRIDIELATAQKNQIGVLLTSSPNSNIIAAVRSDSPFRDLRLPAGTRITGVNGKPVTNLREIQQSFVAAVRGATKEGEKLTSLDMPITAELAVGPPESRTVSQHVVHLGPEAITFLRNAGWEMPMALNLPYFESQMITVQRDNPIDAAMLGLDKTKEFGLQVYVTILRLFQGTVPASELRGPLGIAHIGTKVAEQGWPKLLFFLGVISVNLAVINFLPMPIVDGGLMVFLLIEKLKGSPVSEKVMNAANVVGLLLIGSIFLFTLFHDSMRLFGG